MSEAGQGRVAAADPARPSALERNLKILVVAMGLLIVLGVLTVIGRIIYMASRGNVQSGSAQLAVNPRLALPAGATIRSVSINGDRLAVHFDTSAGSGIAVLDLATGKTLSRIELVPEAPR